MSSAKIDAKFKAFGHEMMKLRVWTGNERMKAHLDYTNCSRLVKESFFAHSCSVKTNDSGDNVWRSVAKCL